MDLSLLTLLRREDVLSVRFSDIHDKALWVIPLKTEGSSHVKLRIACTPALQELIKRCQDNIVSPYLIHRLPERAKSHQHKAQARIHHTQILPERLTRTFKRIRTQVGIPVPTHQPFMKYAALAERYCAPRQDGLNSKCKN